MLPTLKGAQQNQTGMNGHLSVQPPKAQVIVIIILPCNSSLCWNRQLVCVCALSSTHFELRVQQPQLQGATWICAISNIGANTSSPWLIQTSQEQS